MLCIRSSLLSVILGFGLVACGTAESPDLPVEPSDSTENNNDDQSSDDDDTSEGGDETLDTEDSSNVDDTSNSDDSSNVGDSSDPSDTVDVGDGADTEDDTSNTNENLNGSTAYDEPGLFTYQLVQSRDFRLSTGRDVQVSVCLPDGDEPRPLVVLSPGFQLGRDLYQSYCEHFASWGFIAVSQTYSPDVSGFTSSDHASIAEDTNALVDALIAESANGLNIDGENVALVGHSLGGKVSILASTLGTQAKAVVGLDPVDANEPSVTPELMPSLNADLLLLGETLDSTGLFQACAPAENNFEQYFAAAPSGTVSLDIEGAGHMQFHDNPSCFACLACSNGTTAPAEEVLKISRYAATQFLLSRLQGYDGWSERVGAGLLSGGSWSVSVEQSVR